MESIRLCGPHKTASRAACGPRAVGWKALVYIHCSVHFVGAVERWVLQWAHKLM